MGNDPGSHALHRELCDAIAELARSVDIATKRIALRAKISAAIADARKAEKVALALRAAAMQEHDITLSPDPTTQSLGRDIETDVIQNLEEARNRLRESANVSSPLPSKKKEGRGDPSFAQSLLELHDRTGGFLKSYSHV